MSAPERPIIIPVLGSNFAEDFLTRLNDTRAGDEAGVVAMQFEAQYPDESSVVFGILGSMINAKGRGVDAKVIVDGDYVDMMTRIGNRDLPDWVPLASAARRKERRENQARTHDWLEQLQGHGVLERKEPHKTERGYVPRLRQMGSFHPAQALATRHMKGAYIAHTRGDITAWLSTANLTDSDLRAPNGEVGMNNLAVQTHGKVAAFIMRALTDGFTGSSGVHTFEDNNGLMVVHDVGNSGEPARLPRILTEALEAIDPSRSSIVVDPNEQSTKNPKNIVLLSQYPPDGLLFQALHHASDVVGSSVYVPLEPKGDYREKAFPYNVAHQRYVRRAVKTNIVSEQRAQPSHTKGLVVTYDDGSAKIVFGSDNFATHLQKMVRNEELAMVLSIGSKEDQQFSAFAQMIQAFESQGEISPSLARALVADVKDA
jgi:hypothetical protein